MGLGKRIKDLRRSRRMTLVDMAKSTGIDQATLSRMENEKMTGTLGSHMKIAEALSIRLSDLYDSVVNRMNEAKEKAVREKFETFSHSSGAVAELLTSGIIQKKMMPVLLKLKANGSTATEEYPAGAERFIYVLKGSVELILNKQKSTLSQSESLYFDGSKPHTIKNTAKTESRCISVLTPTSL